MGDTHKLVFDSTVLKKRSYPDNVELRALDGKTTSGIVSPVFNVFHEGGGNIYHAKREGMATIEFILKIKFGKTGRDALAKEYNIYSDHLMKEFTCSPVCYGLFEILGGPLPEQKGEIGTCLATVAVGKPLARCLAQLTIEEK